MTGLGESCSSVSDLLLILKVLKNSTQFHDIVSKNSYVIKSGSKSTSIKNTNRLLRENIFGKTGTGKKAKFCFAGYKIDR